jgi:hypothetical protein
MHSADIEVTSALLTVKSQFRVAKKLKKGGTAFYNLPYLKVVQCLIKEISDNKARQMECEASSDEEDEEEAE